MAETQKYSTNCKQCDKNIFFSSFRYDANHCTKKNCWLTCKRFRELAAFNTGSAPEDFLIPFSGTIIVEKEEAANPLQDRSQGYWDHGRWVPWQGSSED